MSKRALLVGCNYPGTNAALRGCINDVLAMQSMLTTYYGFDPANIQIMIDTDPEGPQPTGRNIKAALKQLVKASEPGDALFFHFSGHGTQIPSRDGEEEDAKDEAICPTDMNLICDDDLRVIFKELPPGVKLTMVADCCHSGSMLDQPEVQISGPKTGSRSVNMAQLKVRDLDLGDALLPADEDDEADYNVHNRSIDPDDIAESLSKKTGKKVKKRQLRKGLKRAFGNDSSTKARGLLSWIGQNASGMGGMAGILGQVAAGLAAMNTEDQPVDDNDDDEPDLRVTAPTGAKPPPEMRLPGDTTVLITGCQAHETSADACPSGDPNKAFGALTNSLTTVIKAHYKENPGEPLPTRNLVVSARQLLARSKFAQNPCLECTETAADDDFILAAGMALN